MWHGAALQKGWVGCDYSDSWGKEIICYLSFRRQWSRIKAGDAGLLVPNSWKFLISQGPSQPGSAPEELKVWSKAPLSWIFSAGAPGSPRTPPSPALPLPCSLLLERRGLVRDNNTLSHVRTEWNCSTLLQMSTQWHFGDSGPSQGLRLIRYCRGT